MPPARCAQLAGSWVYSDKHHKVHEYSIVLAEDGALRYVEQVVSGVLHPVSHWFQAQLTADGFGRDLGLIRLCLDEERGTIASQFQASGTSDWCQDTLARRKPEGTACPPAPAPAPVPAKPAQLSDEQRQVLSSVCSGENVFFTGLPGTGKSFTLCRVIESLRGRFAEGELAVCASTGAAACHVGGGTLHSFLGCGLGKTAQDFEGMSRAERRLRKVKAIVIDEISMISGEFLERASEGLSKVMKDDRRPFGGIQIVFCGDFLQLPPITSDLLSGSMRFAFQAPCWAQLGLRTFVLTQNFRQSDDVAFQAVLNRIRVGELTHPDRSMLLRGSAGGGGALGHRVSAQQTTLYCRNIDVERQNLAQLAQLRGPTAVFHADDTYEGNRGSLYRIVEKCMMPQELHLKVGARVMLLKNKRTPSQCQGGMKPLVNGSLGEVVAFETMADGVHVLPVVVFHEGTREVVSREQVSGTVAGVGTYTRSQLPLKLAWAVSVHKSQGMTLEGGTVDLRGAFEEGQVYVALSRFRSAATLTVQGLPEQIRVSVPAKQFHDQLNAPGAALGAQPTGVADAGG